MSKSELLQTSSSAVNTLTMILAGIAAISLLMGCTGIMNIMLVSVIERTSEIGIGILGGVLIQALSTLKVALSFSIMMAAFGFSTAVGIIFGLYPAAKASKLKPIDALSFE